MVNGIDLRNFLNLKFLILIFLLNFNFTSAESKEKPWIGVEFTATTQKFIEFNKLDNSTPKNTIIITGVVETSAADEAGILPGDIVISVDNRSTKHPDDLIGVLSIKKPNDILVFEIYRKGKKIIKSIKLKKFPESNFKPIWVAGSNTLKDPPADYTLENAVFGFSSGILYPDYFPKKILDKYKHDNLTVVCVTNDGKSKLKLYDQIVSINNKSPFDAFPFKPNDKLKVKIIRNGKKINTTITTTVNQLFKLRHNCTPQYADFDCAVDTNKALSIPLRDQKGNIPDERVAAFKKAYECFISNDVPVVPFHNIFEKSKRNVKFDAYIDYLYHLQYQYPEGSPNEQKNLTEIKRVLELANKDIILFDSFQKIYPNHHMKDSYKKIIDRVTSTTAFAGSMYTSEFLSSKDQELTSDKNIVKQTKNILEKLIKEKSYENLETIKYLKSKRIFFEKSNEVEYIIYHYSRAIREVDFTKKEFNKYFYDYYFDLASYYLESDKLDKSIQTFDSALLIAKNNYKNLIFMNAYGKLLASRYSMSMVYESSRQNIQENKDTEHLKSAVLHLDELDKLTKDQKTEMLKIDKNYYLDVLMTANLANLSITPKNKLKKPQTYWPIKSFNYIKKNKDYNFSMAFTGVLSAMLKASLVEDDQKTFNLAENEFKILLANSVNNKKKLYSIFNYSGDILQNYDLFNLNKESDDLINFIDQTFNVNSLQGIQRDISILYLIYKAKSLKRNNKQEEAKLLYEKITIETKIKEALNNSNVNLIHTMVLRKVIPELYEIYATEKNKQKINNITKILFNKNISQLKKRDLRDLHTYLSLNSIKIYKSMLNYFEKSNNKKQFKIVAEHINKHLGDILIHVKNNSYELVTVSATSKIDVINDLAQIAQIYLRNGYNDDGKKILNKAYPIIIAEFNEKASRDLWKPSIQDEVVSNIYLNVVEKKLIKNKSFINKAYSIAQSGKNTYDTRDISKSLMKKQFNDPENLIKQYQDLNRQLTVNLRNKQFTARETANDGEISKDLSSENRELQKKITFLYDEINKKFPSYFKLTKIQTASLKEIQNLLEKDQVLLDYYFFKDNLKIILISKENFKVYSKNINSNQINKLTNDIRKTLIPKNDFIEPFAVNKSFELNQNTFLFINDEISKYKDVIIVPDGPLNTIPLHALAYKKNNNCIDCREVDFNLAKYNFNYFPSVEAFTNLDEISDDYKKITLNISNKIVKNTVEGGLEVVKQDTGVKQLKKLKNLLLKKDKPENKKSVKKEFTEEFYLGLGDPNLYSDAQVKNIDSKNKVTMLRSLFENEKISSSSIKEIYGPVDGSAEEIKEVAKYLSPLKSTILLRGDAQESNFKQLDLRPYKIIHLATHGEISGAISGIDEPFLVLSPPDGSSEEDGLLKMSEIMSLDTNADLVVLSACNTASGDEVGSSGFSGLAKSFFMSGSKSVLVSNWYVETYSAKEIIINLFKNLKDNPNYSISEGLNITMKNMLKSEKERSHPLFWAPFIVVGENKSLFF